MTRLKPQFMIQASRRWNSLPELLIISLIALFACSGLRADPARVGERIQALDAEFQSLSAEFYRSSIANNSAGLRAIEDIDRLLDQVNRLVAEQRSIDAIRLVYFNQGTLIREIDSRALFALTDILLAHNEWRLASQLLNEIEGEGDRSLLASMHYRFARYHARRNEWSEVHRLLEGSISDLAADEAAQAYLLNGSALQYLKKHREAIVNHARVPLESPYYGYAQLNLAIANLRQGWLTEARVKLTDLISASQQTQDDELTYRLYLVLGYALLQHEYYRDAREAFRNIALDSRYTNRALLGIGLTATSQGDFAGGLNALNRLKQKQSFDLSVDESYLLIPYLYERLQQQSSAIATYTEAIDYYQGRLIELNLLSEIRADFSRASFSDDLASLVIQDNRLDYGELFPLAFIHNYRQLIAFSNSAGTPDLARKIESLLAGYDRTFQSVVAELLGRRKQYLTSYLNQSQYGLARLYDSSREETN